MTLVSNDPSWWPLINATYIASYFAVATCVGVMYDWVLTIGQEVELIWRQRWSLMTILYLSTRYLGISFAVIATLINVPTIWVTDVVSLILYLATSWMNVVITAILGVIMIARLHAMYQQSRKVLTFLVIVFLAVNITNGVLSVIVTRQITGEEFILSGTYQCTIGLTADDARLFSMTWIFGTIWEVIVLSLAVWISVKHIRELRQHSAGGIIGDCFTVLMKTHVVYFASFVAVSCFQIRDILSPGDSDPVVTQIYYGFLEIFQLVQMFVLGPRLILSIREYHAKLVADSDAATGMTSIAFQERVHVSTSSSV